MDQPDRSSGAAPAYSALQAATVQPTLTSPQVWAMAVATTIVVANLYYCQPLLAQIAAGWRLSVREVSAIPMVTQVGYACGLFVFVPLGDRIEGRRLVSSLSLVLAATLLVASAAPGPKSLASASFFIGLFAAVAQVLIPMAATLAAPEQRGHVVGFIMGGVLVGVLTARTISGLVGEWAGWRITYIVAGVTMVAVAGGLRGVLPVSDPKTRIAWRALMASLYHLARDHSVLREAAIFGALAFGSLSAFWTTLVFFIGRPPYHYGAAAAGLFGLVGVAGALCSPIFGKLSDRTDDPRRTNGIAMFVGLIGWLALYWLGGSIAGLVVGIVLIDLAVQANHISNYSRIYALAPEARSRINTVYMVSYFIGGSLGTYLGAWAWTVRHWPGVCAVGGLMFALGLALFTINSIRGNHRAA